MDIMDLLDNKENQETLIMIKGKSFMRTFLPREVMRTPIGINLAGKHK
mgnify:CR=1 FL=1